MVSNYHIPSNFMVNCQELKDNVTIVLSIYEVYYLGEAEESCKLQIIRRVLGAML